MFDKLLNFLNELDSKKHFYRLFHNRDDAVSVEIVVPGSRIEVDFCRNGSVEVETFKSDGQIDDESVLKDILT